MQFKTENIHFKSMHHLLFVLNNKVIHGLSRTDLFHVLFSLVSVLEHSDFFCLSIFWIVNFWLKIARRSNVRSWDVARITFVSLKSIYYYSLLNFFLPCINFVFKISKNLLHVSILKCLGKSASTHFQKINL